MKIQFFYCTSHISSTRGPGWLAAVNWTGQNLSIPCTEDSPIRHIVDSVVLPGHASSLPLSILSRAPRMIFLNTDVVLSLFCFQVFVDAVPSACNTHHDCTWRNSSPCRFQFRHHPCQDAFRDFSWPGRIRCLSYKPPQQLVLIPTITLGTVL